MADLTKWANLLSEDDWQTLVIQFAQAHGWQVAHFRPAPDPRRGGRWRTPMEGHPGFPDLVLARRKFILHRELKTQRGRVSKDQQLWLEAMYGEHWEYYVWRPAMWNDIQAQLSSPVPIGPVFKMSYPGLSPAD